MAVFARFAVAVAFVTATFSIASADDDDETTVPAPPPVRGQSLLPANAAWSWQIVTAPRLPLQIGALAASGVDVVAGRRAAPVAVLGDPVPAPAGWPYAIGAGVSAIPKPRDDERIASAFGVATFTLGAADQGLEMLEVRVAYQDGVAVWVNGIEVARSALGRETAMTLASRQHGPEWETFYVPVAPGMLRLGANVIAVEAHPSGRRLSPRAGIDVIGRRDRGVVRGPLVVDVGATTATVVVETDPDVDAALEWRTGGDAADPQSWRRETSAPGRRHRFALASLPANAQVHYRVHAGATQTPVRAFHTMPGPGATIRIGVYGDVRGGHVTHKRLVDHMLAEGLDAVAVTGDMVLHGSDEADWQRFFTITSELLAQVPYLPVVGNHDLGWDGADGSHHADEMFMLPPPPGRPRGTYWYSYDVADVHLVFLDSNSYEIQEQEKWLDADLAAARKKKARAILAFTHDGPYARGYHGGNKLARDHYVPLLAKYHVDMLFSGHDHLYQRGEIAGLRYVVTGGGGASLYGIRCGVEGRPKCSVDDGMVAIKREHHYLTLAVTGRELELCTRRPDGTLLEKCIRYALWRT